MANLPTLDLTVGEDPRVESARSRLRALPFAVRKDVEKALDWFYDDAPRRSRYKRVPVQIGQFTRYTWFLAEGTIDTPMYRPMNDVEAFACLFAESQSTQIHLLLSAISPDPAVALALVMDLLIDRAALAMDADAVDTAARIQLAFYSGHAAAAMKGARLHDASSRGGSKGVRRTGRKQVKPRDELREVAAALQSANVPRRQWVSRIRREHGNSFGSARHIRACLVSLGYPSS